MARGFESKDVEFQQAEAAERGRPGRGGRRALTAAERDDASRRQTIELTVARARVELAGASSPLHRRMLEAAIADLEARLSEPSPADHS